MDKQERHVDSHTMLKRFQPGRDTAYILGAGLSAAFGYPTIRDIFPLIVKAAQTHPFGKRAADEQAAIRLREGLTHLLPGWNLPNVALPVITDVLSLLDQSILARTCLSRGVSQNQSADFRQLMDRIVVKVIANSRRSPDVKDERPAFVNLLLATATGIVTLNYDLEVDLALAERVGHSAMEEPVDYGFSWRDPAEGGVVPRPHNPAFRLMKLHGSLNWLLCPLCEHTYINVYGSIHDQAFYRTKSQANTCHCGHFPLTPVIVSPSYVRDVRNADLLSLWKNALEYLRTSSRWVVIGYSLPAEDLAIRSMLMRAFRAREDWIPVPEVHVVQRVQKAEMKDEDRAFQGRYRSIFPEAVFHYGGLTAFLHKPSEKLFDESTDS